MCVWEQGGVAPLNTAKLFLGQVATEYVRTQSGLKKIHVKVRYKIFLTLFVCVLVARSWVSATKCGLLAKV